MQRKPFLLIVVLSLTLIGSLVACAPAAQPAATAVASQPTAASTSPTTVIPSTGAQPAAATSAPASIVLAAAASTKLNLNTATQADFLTVPNVGSNMVREFLEYRPYTSIAQFEKEIGKYVSAEVVAAYEKYVYVPIAVNSSDAATLMQISGLDQAGAQALIAARPFASSDAFLAALAQHISASDLAAAKALIGG